MARFSQALSRLGKGRAGAFTLKSLEAFGIKIASAGLAFFMFVFLARAMDAQAYGVFGTLFSLATLCAVIGSLGLRSSVMRFAAQYDELGQAQLRRGVTRFGYLWMFAGTLVASLGGSLAVALAADIPNTPALMGGLVILTVGIGCTEYQSRAMRVTASILLALVPRDIVWRLLICGLAAIVALQFGRQSGVAAAWAWVLGGALILTCLVQWIIYEHRVPDKSYRGPADKEARRWVRESLGPWMSQVVISANADVSVVLIGVLMGIDKAGPFFAALRVAQLLNLFRLAIEVILIPAISRKVAVGQWSEVQKLCTIAALLGGGFAALGALGIYVLGDWILGLFGPEMVQAGPALMVLAFGFLLATFAGPTAPLMHMSGHAGRLALFQLIAVLLSLAAMPFAIANHGYIGAALCVAGGTVIWNICAWVFSRRVLRVDPTILSKVLPIRNAGSATSPE